MLDLKFVKKNKQLVENILRERGISNIDLRELLSLQEKRIRFLDRLDSLNRKKKAFTIDFERSVIAQEKLSGKEIGSIREVNKNIRECESNILSLEKKIKEFLVILPNIPHSTVPGGRPGEPNKKIRGWSRKDKFSFIPRTYLEIGKDLGIIDFPESLSVLGFEVIFFKGKGANLQRALINFLMDLHRKNNYSELLPPVIAEGHPVLKLLQSRAFREEELPLGYAAHSLCFRKDWNYSQDSKNDIKRVRQFDSIELTRITTSGDSYRILEIVVSEVEEALRLLELPYEVNIFTKGNLDYVASKAYSIKVFLPGLSMFLETSVCSNLGDFFSREIDIAYKKRGSKDKSYAHIVKATNLIIPRAMMGILENFQQRDGSLIIPKVLRPYLKGLNKITIEDEKG